MSDPHDKNRRLAADFCRDLGREDFAEAVSRSADRIADLERQLADVKAKLNTPELIDFREAVVIEAAHQRERWGSNHDADKTAADWFWLIGYLAGKALHADKAGETDKLRHHIITTAAACANWHAATERIRT